VGRLGPKTIIEKIGFDLAENETLSILGPNGSGKTVLLKALLNLVPHSGEISCSPQVAARRPDLNYFEAR
jgi:ABC-type Mn2+/Zn2+ transport system ATPase subunit